MPDAPSNFRSSLDTHGLGLPHPPILPTHLGCRATSRLLAHTSRACSRPTAEIVQSSEQHWTGWLTYGSPRVNSRKPRSSFNELNESSQEVPKRLFIGTQS